MAVTGTGTEQDPWLVHDYYEMTDLFNRSLGENAYSTFYAQLAENINCNDYGDDFEWENITIGSKSAYNGNTLVFDLGGHTIKNVKVKSNNAMFTLNGAMTGKIQNGIIRNVFLSGATSLITSPTNNSVLSATAKNLSIAVDATGMTSYLFCHVLIDTCAINCVSNSALAQPLFATINTSETIIKNCDIKLEIANANEKNIIGIAQGFGGSVYKIADCRFTGFIKGRACGAGSNRFVLSRNLSYMDSCCFNVDFSEMWGDSPTVKWMVKTIINGTLSGCVVNGDLGNGYVTGNFVANSQEIVNGDALRSKGFVVVNVSA